MSNTRPNPVPTNAPTRYELAIEHAATGRKYLVRYTVRRSRSCTMEQIRSFGEALAALTGAEEFRTGKRAGDPITIGEWSVRYTGRTQRDARAEGELVFLPAAPELQAWRDAKAAENAGRGAAAR